ncbi:MAG: hypothetical protein ACFFDC_06485 [Promethearchaeota archaeon]
MSFPSWIGRGVQKCRQSVLALVGPPKSGSEVQVQHDGIDYEISVTNTGKSGHSRFFMNLLYVKNHESMKKLKKNQDGSIKLSS